MKKNLFLIGVAMTFGLSMAACSAKDIYTTDTKVLPQEAMTAITSNFQGVNVSQIKVDKESMGDDEYEVTLSNGTKIDFDKSGAVKEVKAAVNDSVPANLIPVKVREYIAANYASQKVREIELDKKGIEVKLSSGMELKFDAQGNFLKID